MLFLGIDVGGTSIKGVIVDQSGQILARAKVETKAQLGVEAVINQIELTVKTLLQEGNITIHEVKALGIGTPGQIDREQGIIRDAGNLHFKDVPLKSLLEERLYIPVFLGNDAQLATLGEAWLGAGQGASNLVMITLGTGIGGGIIINGSIYHGVNGTAGELGHMKVLSKGLPCSCGQSGCWETVASGTAMLRRAKELLTSKNIALCPSQGALTVRVLKKAAEQGDKVALQVFEETAYYLGLGLSNIINIFNPEIIIVGGGVGETGDILLQPAVEQAKSLSLRVPAKTVRITQAQLGNDAGALGASKLAIV